MNTGANNPGEKQEDIDLLLLVERAILFFRKYKKVFLIALVSGLALGIGFYSRLPKVYKSRLILHSYTLSNPDFMEIIDNWADMRKNGGTAALAETFNCREEIIRRMKNIKATEIQKVFTPNNPNGFSITVYVTDNVILEELQEGILYGLENSEYIRRKLIVKKENLNEMIGKTITEISKLDSTKKMMENIMEGKGRSSSSIIIEGAMINKQMIEMNERLLGYREDLKFAQAVQVLQGFSKFKSPAGPHLVVWIGLGLIAGLSVAWVYALYNSIKVKLKNRSLPRPAAKK